MRSIFFACVATALSASCFAQTLTNSELYYTTYATGLTTPVAFEFLDNSTMLVNEKVTGKVKVFVNGTYAGDALDLPVSSDPSASDEMGLLGLVKDPDFTTNHYIYLFYSRATVDAGPWLDDRLVRYTWNGTTLDSPQVIWVWGPTAQFPNPSTWHHGGYLRFGPDGKLYIQRGDMLRFGCMEMNNNPASIGEAASIYRINKDGTAPLDNPFISNPNPIIQKIWIYGMRNAWGMDWDRSTLNLWYSENGPEIYDEVNIAHPGMNGGWRLIMGPDYRNAAYPNNNNTPHNANELYYLPGATYYDPVFSYLDTIGVAGIAFFSSTRFLESPNTFDNLILGCTNTSAIYMLPVAPNRQGLNVSGDLSDFVADTAAERDLWLMGNTWGAIVDARIGPDGYMYVASWNHGKIRKIMPKNDAVDPSTVNIIRGNVVGGNPTSSLMYSDNSRLDLRPGPVLSTSQSPIVVEVSATAGISPTPSLKFVIEVSATSSSIRQQIELYNYNTSSWELVDQQNLTTSDKTIVVTATGDVSRFINASTKQVRARISHRQIAAVLSYPFTTKIDMIHWVTQLP